MTGHWNTLQPEIRQQLINRLSPRQHSVLVLRLAGCSYKDIAELLGLSERTIRKHLERAQQVHAQIEQENT